MASRTAPTVDTTRRKILDAASSAIAQYGPRKVSLTDVAELAGVSRPTLYRYFSSKEELLRALSAHEKSRFETSMADAVRGLSGEQRLDRALRFIVEFQRDYPFDRLVLLEPAFMLDQLERSLRTMASGLVPFLEDVARPPGTKRADLADLVMRVALSHFLIRGSDAQLLRQLRHVVGLDA